MPVKRRKKPAAKKASKPKQPKKKVSKKKSPPAAHPIRKALNAVEAVLLRYKSRDAHHLWNILAAMRGPDGESWTIKNEFTSPIRGWAFPKVVAVAKDLDCKIPASFVEWNANKPPTRGPTYDQQITVGVHYARHIRDALRAIKYVETGKDEEVG